MKKICVEAPEHNPIFIKGKKYKVKDSSRSFDLIFSDSGLVFSILKSENEIFGIKGYKFEDVKNRKRLSMKRKVKRRG